MMESVLRDAEPAAFYENSDRVIQEQTSSAIRSHRHRLVILSHFSSAFFFKARVFRIKYAYKGNLNLRHGDDLRLR